MKTIRPCTQHSLVPPPTAYLLHALEFVFFGGELLLGHRRGLPEHRQLVVAPPAHLVVDLAAQLRDPPLKPVHFALIHNHK